VSRRGLLQDGGAGFGRKACSTITGLVNELQSDEAAKLEIFGLVDNTPTAATEFLDDLVVRDGLADHWPESYGLKRDKSMKVEQLPWVHQKAQPAALISGSNFGVEACSETRPSPR
jgi:hypothetical protein